MINAPFLYGNELISVTGVTPASGIASGVTQRVPLYAMPNSMTENVYNFTSQNLKNWRKAKANVKAGAANARVVFIGDSTTFGANAAGTWITPNITASVAGTLNSAGLPATDNSFCGCSVPTGSTGNRLTTDARISAGSWTSTNPGDFTLGGTLMTISSGASPLTFTPLTAVDTFNYFWHAYGSNGSISIKAGSGSATVIPANTGGGPTFTSVTNTLGVQAFSATYVSGSVFYGLGIEAYNSAVKSINIMNAGHWGSISANWTGSSQTYSPLPVLGILAPSLTVITPGINDWGANTSVATFTANIQTIITKAQLSGDVILMTPTPNTNNVPLQTSYMTALYALAEANNCVLIDNWSRWVNYATTNPLGFYSDGIHPTNIGYEDQANTLAKILINA